MDKGTTIQEKRAFWLGSNLMMLTVLASAVWLCIDAVREPTVRVLNAQAHASLDGMRGTVVGSTVRLADPGPLDRLVAASPSLAAVVMAMAVLVYCSWMDWRNISGPAWLKGNNRQVALMGMMSFLVILVPSAFQAVTAAYFGVRVSFEWDGSTVLLFFLVAAHLFIRVHENRQNWASEYSRAEGLDEQMKSVV